MEYFFGHFGSVILAMSTPKCCPPASRQLKGLGRRSGRSGDGMGNTGETFLVLCKNCSAAAKTQAVPQKD